MFRLVGKLLLALLLSALTGCGYTILGGVIALVATGNSRTGKGVVAAPPEIRITSPLDRASLPDVKQVAVDFTLVDATSAPLDVDASWVSSGTVTRFPVTPAAASAALTGLASSPGGTQHTFVWDVQSDVARSVSPAGSPKVATVTLSLVPRRGSVAGLGAEATALLGLTPPRVAIVAVAAGQTTASGNVATSIVVADDASDPVDVHLFVSAPGLVRHEVPLLGQSTGIPTSPGAGRQVQVVWNSADPAALGFINVTATLEVDVTDRFGTTGSAQASIAVVNNTAPTAQILSVGTASSATLVDGRIPIRFALFDREADLDPGGPSGTPDVTIEFSSDGGVTWRPATGLVLRQGIRDLGLASLSGLRAHAFPITSDNVHTFIWDALRDGIGGVGALANAAVRVTPTKRGTSGTLALAGQPDVRPLTLGVPVDLLGDETILTQPAPGGSLTLTVLLGDLNGDGILDMVSQGDSQWFVRLGNGDGTFGAATAIATTGEQLTALLDANGDGSLDIVGRAGTSNPNFTLVVLPGDGSGGFGAPIATTLGAKTPAEVDMAFAFGDMDGDGIPDAVGVSYDPSTPLAATRLFVAQGVGNGQFGPPTAYATAGASPAIALADLDGDGLLDVIYGNVSGARIDVRLGSGGGALGPSIASAGGALAPGDDPQALKLADLDNDGSVDVVVVNQVAGTLDVLFGDGRGGFGRLATYGIGTRPTDVALVDLDGDGRPDIVACDTVSNDISIRLGLAGGAFGVEKRLPILGVHPDSIAVGDLDGDGLPDVVYGNGTTHDLGVRLNAGGGGVAPDRPLPVPTNSLPVAIATGDLNGDGILDLVVTDFFGNTLSVWLGTGNGGFGVRRTFPLGVSPNQVALTDLNGDGILDAVVTNFFSSTLSVLLGDGAGGFQPQVVIAPVLGSPASLGALAVADLDGDGKIDLVISDPLQILLGRGDGTFGAPTLVGGTTTGVGQLLISDVNGDGVLDLVVAYSSGPTSGVTIRFGAGAGVFGPEVTVFTDLADPPMSLALADLDGDGRLDLVVGRTSGTTSIFRGIGGGAFERLLSFASPGSQSAASVAVGDIDGDGRLDIVASQTNQSSFVLQSNDLSILFQRRGTLGLARGAPRPGRGEGEGERFGFFRQHLRLPFASAQAAIADVTDDGIADLIMPGFTTDSVTTYVSCAVRGSTDISGFRSVLVEPLDFSMPLPRLGLPAGTILPRASLTRALLPETQRLASATTIALPLDASLTAQDLTQGVLHVFRWEQDSGVSFDPVFRAKHYGRVVEVARRDPANPPLPAGVVPATVDLLAGTIQLPVTRLGRYGVYLEAPDTRLVLFRESFDGAGELTDRTTSLPQGWYGGAGWTCGAPFPSQLTPGPSQRPSCASAPNLLAIGLQHDYPPGVVETVTSAAFDLPPIGARTATLTLGAWFDLAGADRVDLTLVLKNAAGNVSRQPLTSFTGTSAGPIAFARVAVSVTTAIQNGEAALGTLSEGRLELKLTSASPGPTARGFFIDDLELTYP